MGDAAVDVGHFEALDAVVGDVGHEVDVVDVELAVLLALGVDLTEQFDLGVVEVLAHFLDHPNVAEELGSEVAVADDGLADHVQVGVDELDDLLLGTDALGGYLVELVAQALELALDDGLVDVLLGLEVGVERSAALARRQGDVVHRGVLEPVLGKELAGDVN